MYCTWRMDIPEAVRSLERELREVFGSRLQSLVAYRATSGDTATPTLVVVDTLSADDLRACAARVDAWHDQGLATPLLLAAQEFGRSLDVFPFEFGAILADHAIVTGTDPFDGLRVDPTHLRSACEVQARSHLLHLREGFVEARGRGDLVADLIVRSSPALAALLMSVARLEGSDARDRLNAASAVERVLGLPAGVLSRIVTLSPGVPLSSDNARSIFPVYLDAVERLTAHVDRWQHGQHGR
jgi:hypothetical protein